MRCSSFSLTVAVCFQGKKCRNVQVSNVFVPNWTLVGHRLWKYIIIQKRQEILNIDYLLVHIHKNSTFPLPSFSVGEINNSTRWHHHYVFLFFQTFEIRAWSWQSSCHVSKHLWNVLNSVLSHMVPHLGEGSHRYGWLLPHAWNNQSIDQQTKGE